MFNLEHKSAVITGAGSGIGRAVALLFARQGAHVHLLDLNEAALQEVAEEIESGDGKATTHECDVTVQDAVRRVFTSIGSIDILVNSAGISHIGRADTTSEEDFDRVYRVKLKGIYNCLHEAIPLMKAAGRGVILNMASIANHVGLPDRFAYST